MSSREIDLLAELVTDALASGPMTGYELARALDLRHGLRLGGRQGTLYAALVHLGRRGYVDSEWVERPDGARRRCYTLPVLTDLAAGERG